jgi:Calcineurin-like phosphoesterase
MTESCPSRIRKTLSGVFLCQAILLLSSAVFGQAVGADAVKTGTGNEWRFAVSGDSRNCGDVVMPAIAQGVREDGAAFYWHLGDFRAIAAIDQDFKALHPNVATPAYETAAWPDFIDKQLSPFGDLPVYLGLGNHETISPKTRAEAIQQFADWLDTPELRSQRLRDDPGDHVLKFYYHWVRGAVDFITLDNATEDQFDAAQMAWLTARLDRDAENPDIRSIVLGMHEALPDSIGAGHSMNESEHGTASGRKVYQQLVEFRHKTHRNVYVLASHSHFFMDNVYNTVCRRDHPDEILPGWIVGTAGAVRYRLPADVSGSSQHATDVYGYLLGTVLADGSVRFEFKRIKEENVTESTRKTYEDTFIHTCFAGNASDYVPDGPLQPPHCP